MQTTSPPRATSNPKDNPDLRRRRQGEMVHLILLRAQELAPEDAALLRSVYADSLPVSRVAALIRSRGTDVRTSTLRRRLKSLTTRVLSPRFVFVMRHRRDWPPPMRRVAASCLLQGRTLRQAAADLRMSRHNVHGHIPIADALRMKSRVSAETWNAEMLCLRALRTHSVYPAFDPALHVIASDAFPCSTFHSPLCSSPLHPLTPSPFHLLAGIDFGYRAPTVILWALHDPASNTLTIIDERSESELILDTHVRAILDSPHGMPGWIGIDPSGNQRNEQTGVSAAEVLRRAGLKVKYRSFPTQAGIDLVAARLKPAHGPPRLFIHARCLKLIEALEKYHYDDKNPESLEPVKDGPDHAADALRYLITNLDRPYITRFSNYLR